MGRNAEMDLLLPYYKDQNTLGTGQSSLLLGRRKPRQQNLRQPKQDPESLGDQQSRQANRVRCPLVGGVGQVRTENKIIAGDTRGGWRDFAPNLTNGQVRLPS